MLYQLKKLLLIIFPLQAYEYIIIKCKNNNNIQNNKFLKKKNYITKKHLKYVHSDIATEIRRR